MSCSLQPRFATGRPSQGEAACDQQLADLAAVGQVELGQRAAVAVDAMALDGDVVVAEQLSQLLLGLKGDDQLGLAARVPRLGCIRTFEADALAADLYR